MRWNAQAGPVVVGDTVLYILSVAAWPMDGPLVTWPKGFDLAGQWRGNWRRGADGVMHNVDPAQDFPNIDAAEIKITAERAAAPAG